jgi:dual specificity protein kinase YAK1
MNNRVAFIDFVRGLLTTNPLERWSPQQAKLHPMNLKVPPNKPPAPGVQQQQHAEAMSKQRAAQAAQVAQAQVQAQNAAYAMQASQYQQPAAYVQPPPVYNNQYATHQQGAPPPYPTHATGYAPQMGMMSQQSPQIAASHFGHQPSLYQQATQRAGRQRASTMDQQQSGIPAAIQRVASHLDPNQPIRLQPSPAYYPPPPDGYVDSPSSARRRGSRNQRNRDFIRTLEDGAMGDTFMNKSQWH